MDKLYIKIDNLKNYMLQFIIINSTLGSMIVR